MIHVIFKPLSVSLSLSLSLSNTHTLHTHTRTLKNTCTHRHTCRHTCRHTRTRTLFVKCVVIVHRLDSTSISTVQEQVYKTRCFMLSTRYTSSIGQARMSCDGLLLEYIMLLILILPMITAFLFTFFCRNFIENQTLHTLSQATDQCKIISLFWNRWL